MGDGRGLPLWPSEERVVSNDESSNVVEARNTGVLPYQRLVAMVRDKTIISKIEIEPDQYQPASLDLRLGRYAYRVRASFLAGPNATVMERVKDLDGMPPIDLEGGAVLERGAVYVVELMEAVTLNADTLGIANPKSSTGRLDVLTRLITDRGTAFDRIEKSYDGQLYIEIAPLTFSIVVYPGVRLNQVRFQRDRGNTGGLLSQTDTEKFYTQGQFVRSPVSPLPKLREGVLVPVTVDLEGAKRGDIIGYKAKKNSSRIDVRMINYYDPTEYWEKIESANGRLNLDKDDFYILATREEVGVPPQTAAEMVPYDTRSGEFRVHYAGFFDPGFGWANGKAGGSKAVLEVRSHGVPFTLEHGQIIGWLRYAQIATGYTDRLYGGNDLKSNYQGQGVALAKQFRKWPA
jgi:dCTP deaminase